MKVGDYARTKYGIKQIYEIDNNRTVWKYKFKLKKQDGDGCINLGCFSDSDVIKSSPNITDLIEVGDYVNGYRVIDFDYSVANTRIRIWIDTENEKNYIFKNEIKSIVTHEQFSQMEYRIGE